MLNFLCSIVFFMTLSGCEPRKDSPSVESPVIVQPVDPSPPPKSPAGETPIVEPDPKLEPAPTPAPVPPTSEAPPEKAGAFKVNIIFSGNEATAVRKAKYQKAIDLLTTEIAAKAFKDKVLAHKYDGKAGFASSSDTPLQVYNKLLSGAESLSPTVDNELDLEVRFYYAANSTVGYTYPGVKYIMVNTKFFDGYNTVSVARNLLHEYMHKLGYGHDSSRTTRRPYSVPYAMGSML